MSPGLQKRKKALNVVLAAILLFIVLDYTYQTILLVNERGSDGSTLLSDTLNLLMVAILTAISLWAMRFIHKN